MADPDKPTQDLVEFAAEPDSVEDASASLSVWKILIADDDEEIHAVTKVALKNLRVQGRKLEFLSAYSGEEAIQVLSLHHDVAVVLLDVVMENDNAGLAAVKRIREGLNNQEIRIILRTGQPGYAPEESVVQEYDINDYKTKTELTKGHLVTAVVSSIRSYQQIRAINQNRKGLEKIIHAGSHLMEMQSLQAFSDGVVTQISSLLGLDAEGVLCARLDDEGKEGERVYVMGAAGRYAPFIDNDLERITNPHIVYQVKRCLHERHHLFNEHDTTLYIGNMKHVAAVYIQSHRPIVEDDRRLIEVFINNITVSYENVALFKQLRHAAYTDPVTRTPNRNEFTRLLETVSGNGETLRMVVVLVDIDHFSDINDGLGQEVGNALLNAVAERLQTRFSAAVTLARIDADVFGMIGLESVLAPEDLAAAFSQPFVAQEHHLPVSATFGYARFADIGAHGLTMLKRAYIALNVAKKQHKGHYAFYDARMEETTEQRLVMIRSLRGDFSHNKLALWFQPQIDLTSRRVIGMEALLRWPQPDGGFIPPDVFIPIAEYSGLIVDIGEWVMREACQQLQSLQRLGFNGLRMAVNVSMPQFRDKGFVGRVKRCLESYQIRPQQLELEITESVIMDEPEVVIDVLNQLKNYGVQVALDDFGTGFSSLNYLRRLPLDRIKVDRSFVNDIDQPSGAVIAETIVNLGIKLGLHTIAEGIETDAQEQALRDLGCMEAQGYKYAKPLPSAELMDFLSHHRDRGVE